MASNLNFTKRLIGPLITSINFVLVEALMFTSSNCYRGAKRGATADNYRSLQGRAGKILAYSRTVWSGDCVAQGRAGATVIRLCSCLGRILVFVLLHLFGMASWLVLLWRLD